MSIFIIAGEYNYSVLRKGASEPTQGSGSAYIIISTEKVSLPPDLKEEEDDLQIEPGFTNSKKSIKKILWRHNTWSDDKSVALKITSVDDISCDKIDQKKLEQYLRE